jgi:hypothetical protein
LPILSAPDVVQTVAVPPPMVVMVYGKRMELDCATSSGAEVNPAHAKRTVAARTVARTTRIIRPRTFQPLPETVQNSAMDTHAAWRDRREQR